MNEKKKKEKRKLVLGGKYLPFLAKTLGSGHHLNKVRTILSYDLYIYI